ncbi:YfhO family protein [Robertkochia sediminum]|uniref:YfhO family protein n=1 Tax=Robertkochia sediminum TaxID=2785326 RepID=UPI001931B095|nr:YfhO family protein [Robertkochia sediminum]MBL7473445.1 YfhO family protein [Robertkochia sediminum]
MADLLKKAVPHFVVLFLFMITALLYFSPVLQGKKIFQSDIVQYIGMAHERDQHKQATGEESYWTNSAFGGMPTYQLGANYPHNYIKELDRVLRFLPRPADYLFLYFIGFYIFMLVLRVPWKLAAIGALGFGFSTYLIIILGVGHNAKAHAVAYFPWVLSGIVLALRKRYVAGFLLTALGMALEISANHFQMTYYLLLLVLVLGLVYLIDAVKNKELPDFFKAIGVLVLAVVLAIGTNAANLMATSEYAAWSTRGSKELTTDPEGNLLKKSSGLDKDYITAYSYGLMESFNLFSPRLFGGADQENVGEDSNTFQFLINQGVPRSQATGFVKALPMYWGGQPGVAAPAYVGAVLLFFFVLGIFLVKEKHKWWLAFGALLSLVLSWGKNFELLTNFMIDHFPLYDKFRAITSVQVILELCVPVLAVMALAALLNKDRDHNEKANAIKYTAMIFGGIGVILFLLKGTFDFAGAYDDYYAQSIGPEVVDMIIRDRKAFYTQDLLRSIVLVALAGALSWLWLKDKLKQNLFIAGVGVLILFDLVVVDRRYVNEEDFVQARVMNKPFRADAADNAILQDDDDHFRVFNLKEGLNGASTSFFHHSLGGYHAAKPKRIQELYEYQIARNNPEVLNMLNVKYLKRPDEQGAMTVIRNPDVNGNAWFVSSLVAVQGADAEMAALSTMNTKEQAVFDETAFGTMAKYQGNYAVDSLTTIKLEQYRPDVLVYRSTNDHDGIAVFSEMYYPHGWKATIDGEPADTFRVNYALRALFIPEGTHEVVFTFDPEVVKTGSTLGLISNLLLLLCAVGGGYLIWKKQSEQPKS